MKEQELTEQVAGLKAELAKYDAVAERSAVEGLAVLETAAQKIIDLTAERDLAQGELAALVHLLEGLDSSLKAMERDSQLPTAGSVLAALECIRINAKTNATEFVKQLNHDHLDYRIKRLETENEWLERDSVELKARLKNCHREIGQLRLSVERYQSNMQSTLNVFRGRRMRIEEREAWAAKYIEDAYRERDRARAELEKLRTGQAPIDMILFCPRCQFQHVDAPQPEKEWDNPPHRSHECQQCGHIWRPADVPTNGVERIKTQGQHDHAAIYGGE